MSHHRKAKIAIAKCEKCNMIHLIVEQDQCIVASVPMTRGEWAQLIGAYGDMMSSEPFNPPN